ncbi:MAG: hypothetical protein NDJ89_00725 [Oligoflexia bacterium]|nr:hypothetical protein [Oligoflexia bacterium]
MPRLFAKSRSTSAPKANDPLDDLVSRYGDLLYDLSEAILWSSPNAQVTFRAILKALRKNLSAAPAGTHERAWTLRVACMTLRPLASRLSRTLTAAEQIQLDAAPDLAFRFNQFNAYFHRLSVEDQLLLLLKDKYGIPLPEVAIALDCPEESLKIRRQLALRALEEWLWDTR